ncbi:peptide deformylase [Microvirga thermotolerans]|uniref:Peptide deformylase-like n=1 Tax=Microvirga thermotolerans TaxID=2651334 RepID=A0A5P9JSI8_9HYPH|nr:peptide deformylase [Microvirga thermotolerans]QFU15762.1 peptide deformylase [Microvirga thermotolerans]
MAVRPLVRFPDPRLRLPATPVTAFDAALEALAQDLLDTMHAAPGVGITAPHVGVPLRLAVIEIETGAGPSIYVNPRIVDASRDRIRHVEGSVSMPGVTEEVERAARVRVAFQDLEGRTHEEEAEGFLAVCLQHEIDQLDGIFWIDRLSRLKRDRLVKRFGKLEKRER